MDHSATTTTTTCADDDDSHHNNGPTTIVVVVDVIVMDDNFYWRSMRKQVYQTCQAQAKSMIRPIYHATILLQAPLNVCLERNSAGSRRGQQQRKRRVVAPHVLERMERTLESPVDSTLCRPSTSAWWEKDPSCVLTLDGTDAILDNVPRCLDLVHCLVRNDTGRVVATAHADKLAAHHETTAAHQSDQFWRKCVAATVQRHRSWGAHANRVRKHCRQVWYRGESETRKVFDPHVCWKLFCNGIPTSGPDPATSWLSLDDKDFMRGQLVSYFNQDADFDHDAQSVPQTSSKENTDRRTG
jgi:hypothetical protein